MSAWMKRFTILAILFLIGCQENRQSEYSKLLEQAHSYAKLHNLEVVRQNPPLIEIISFDAANKKYGVEKRDGWTWHGATLPDKGLLLLTDKHDKTTKWHEYGHWFFWQDRDAEKEEEIADDFAEYVMKCRK